MLDQNANWRNHRWSYDSDYTERESAPILESLIELYGIMFDDVYIYIFQGKLKQYIIRFPHYGLPRTNHRMPMEKHIPKDPHQKKLKVFIVI